MAVTNQRFRNTWAVVYIDSSWRFIDCHWGARHVTNTKDEQSSAFCYELDEFFFLTDPEDHIYMHYPDEKVRLGLVFTFQTDIFQIRYFLSSYFQEWQLLNEPLSVERFSSLPVLKSHFFSYGLRLPENTSSIINTDSGKVEVVLHTTLKVKVVFIFWFFQNLKDAKHLLILQLCTFSMSFKS